MPSKLSRMAVAFVLGALVGSVATCAPSRIRLLKNIPLASQCDAHLTICGIALDKYAEAHGSLPLSLDELVKAGLVGQDYLRCPATGQRYIYFFEGAGAKKEQMSRGFPLVACRGFPHGPWKFFVTWWSFSSVPEATIVEALDNDRPKLAELLAKAVGTPPEGVEVLKRLLLQGGSSPSAAVSAGAPARSGGGSEAEVP